MSSKNAKKGVIKGKRERYAEKNKSRQGGRNEKKPSQIKAQHAQARRDRRERKPVERSTGENSQYIQWFPGHMTRTKRKIQADLKLVDAVAEIIDARVPMSRGTPIFRQ